MAVLIAAASVTFFAQLAIPGDRATIILNLQNGRDQKWSAAELAPVNDKFGFDHPLLTQYLHYIGGFFKGDLGTSYTQYRPVTAVIGAQLHADPRAHRREPWWWRGSSRSSSPCSPCERGRLRDRHRLVVRGVHRRACRTTGSGSSCSSSSR